MSQRFKKSPDHIDEEELREYFLYLKNEKQVADSTFSIALCGIKFFYEQTLKKEWHTLKLVRPDRKMKLPVILSVDEVKQILGCVHHWQYHVCLNTIYACGLRLLEGVRLQVKNITGGRKMIHERAFQAVLRESGVHKQASIHTLRLSPLGDCPKCQHGSYRLCNCPFCVSCEDILGCCFFVYFLYRL